MHSTKSTQTTDRFAVLVDVGCDWPEVVLVGDRSEAARLAQSIPDEIAVSVQAVVALDAQVTPAAHALATSPRVAEVGVSAASRVLRADNP
jgi:hypothetical protein